MVAHKMSYFIQYNIILVLYSTVQGRTSNAVQYTAIQYNVMININSNYKYYYLLITHSFSQSVSHIYKQQQHYL